MRDFRDAKVMAHALRDALRARSVETTHSESLELIAKAFGFDNWNVLSAKIEAARPRLPPADTASPADAQTTAYCTFCGKSQHDVATLIAGPSSTYICDECVVVCNDVIDGKSDRAFFDLLQSDEQSGTRSALEHLRSQSTEDLTAFVERNRRGAQVYRVALDEIQFVLAARDGAAPDQDVLAAPRFARLKGQSTSDLHATRKETERALKRREHAVGMALDMLSARR